MGNLILDSLEIRNFRAFEHLTIESLGRVNLITGKNGVGKSALLEAIWLYARRGNPDIMLDMLDLRDELPKRSSVVPFRTEEQEAALLLSFKHFFHGRQNLDVQNAPVYIGLARSEDRALTITITLRDSTESIPRLWFDVHVGNQAVYSSELIKALHSMVWYWNDGKSIPGYFVKPTGLDEAQIGQLWDNIALTPREDDVIAALNIVAPDVKRIAFISEDDRNIRRIPVVVENGGSERLPLRSLGEGLVRLFGIALSLVNSTGGVLLIDEIESGLHYSVLPTVFKLIFNVAHRLNIQVFATTHSWECIEAFQRAAAENHEDQGILIRLQNRKSGVVPTLFDEEALSIVTRELIEVR